MSRFLLLILILGASQFSEGNSYAQSANATPKEQQAHGENLPEKGVAPPDPKAVIGQGTTADHNADNNKREGASDPEQRIAEYTVYGFWVAVGQLGAAVIGIIYIIRTLRVTQRQTAEIIKQTKEFASQGSDFSAQTKLMRETHDAEQRPWLSITCSLASGFIEGTTHEGVKGYYLTLLGVAKNHGQSPATNVIFVAEIGLSGPDSMDDQMMNRFCDRYRENINHIADAIFPDVDKNMSHQLFLSEFQIDKALSESDINAITPVVYGCVLYRSSHTKGVKQTRFAYHIATRSPDGHAMAFIKDGPGWMKKQIGMIQIARITAD